MKTRSNISGTRVNYGSVTASPFIVTDGWDLIIKTADEAIELFRTLKENDGKFGTKYENVDSVLFENIYLTYDDVINLSSFSKCGATSLFITFDLSSAKLQLYATLFECRDFVMTTPNSNFYLYLNSVPEDIDVEDLTIVRGNNVQNIEITEQYNFTVTKPVKSVKAFNCQSLIDCKVARFEGESWVEEFTAVSYGVVSGGSFRSMGSISKTIAFSGCEKVEDVSAMIAEGSALRCYFENCSNVSNVTLDAYDSGGDRTDVLVCKSCTNVRGITISPRSNVGIKNFSYSIEDCVYIQGIWITGYNADKATISYSNCSYAIPSTLQYYPSTSGDNGVVTAKADVYNHQTSLYFTVKDGSGSGDNSESEVMSLADDVEIDTTPDVPAPSEDSLGGLLMTTNSSNSEWTMESLKEFLCSHVGVVFPVVPVMISHSGTGVYGILTGITATNCEELAAVVIDLSVNRVSKASVLVSIALDVVNSDTVYKV